MSIDESINDCDDSMEITLGMRRQTHKKKKKKKKKKTKKMNKKKKKKKQVAEYL